MEITELAKQEAEKFPLVLDHVQKAEAPDFGRIVQRDAAFAKDDRIKMKAFGRDGFSINHENVDMRYVEQLVDEEQLRALAQMLKYMKLHIFDGKRSVQEAVETVYKSIDDKEFEAFCGKDVQGDIALPRKQELYAAINRCRELVKVKSAI